MDMHSERGERLVERAVVATQDRKDTRNLRAEKLAGISGFIVETRRCYASGPDSVEVVHEDDGYPAIFDTRDDARAAVEDEEEIVTRTRDPHAVRNLHMVRNVATIGHASEAAWAFYMLTDAATERLRSM